MPLIFLSVACAAAVMALLWAEYRQNRLLKWAAKPAASLCFVLLALAGGGLESAYGGWIIAGLALCLVGDILLIPSRQSWFLAGMAAFALGHGAYIGAFLTGTPLFSSLTLIAAAAVSTGVTVSLWRLWPHLGSMKLPVAGYTAIIAVMVIASFAAAPNAHSSPYWLVIIGAVGFSISDLSVARDQFVSSDFFNRLWGLPLYYASQLALASSV